MQRLFARLFYASMIFTLLNGCSTSEVVAHSSDQPLAVPTEEHLGFLQDEFDDKNLCVDDTSYFDESIDRFVCQTSMTSSSGDGYVDEEMVHPHPGVMVLFKKPALWNADRESIYRLRGQTNSWYAARAVMKEYQLNQIQRFKKFHPAMKIGRSFQRSINGVLLKDISLAAAKKIVLEDPELKHEVSWIGQEQLIQATVMSASNAIRSREVLTSFDPQGRAITGHGIRVGIIDTGVDYLHSDLGGCMGETCKFKGGYDFVNNDPDPMDDHGHGTHVAGTIAGNGHFQPVGGAATPFQGIAPNAVLYGYKVLSAGGSGSPNDVIAGIEACTDPNDDGDPADALDICNMSLGGPGNPDDPLSQAVDTASAFTLFVIAAGNSGKGGSGDADTVGSPGTSRKALTVAASCKPEDQLIDGSCKSGNGTIAEFSSRGPVIWKNTSGVEQILSGDEAKPDIAAPGVNICATQYANYASSAQCGDDMHISIDGTSMATPVVAGAAALVKQAFPHLTPEQLKRAIKEGASPLGNRPEDEGRGQVNLSKTLQLLGGLSNQMVQITNPFFTLTDQPRESSQTLTQNLGLKLVDTTMSSFKFTTVSLETPVNGLSVEASNLSSFALSSNAREGNLQLVFKMNYDQLSTGTYQIAVQLVSQSDVRLLVPVTLRILPRIHADTLKVNLKGITPEPTNFVRSFPIKLKNNMKSQSLPVTVTLECCTGANQKSYPGALSLAPMQTVNLPPNSEIEVPLQFDGAHILTNYVTPIPNQRYFGTLKIDSPRDHLEIPVTYYKGYVLGLHVEAEHPDTKFYLADLERLNKDPIQGMSSDKYLEIYLTQPSKYLLQYLIGGDIYLTKQIEISAGVTDVTLREADATETLVVKGIAHTGEKFFPNIHRSINHEIVALRHRMSGRGTIMTNPAGRLFRGWPNKFSPLSDDYSLSISASAADLETQSQYHYSVWLPKASNLNRTITPSASEISQRTLSHDLAQERLLFGLNFPIVYRDTSVVPVFAFLYGYDKNKVLKMMPGKEYKLYSYSYHPDDATLRNAEYPDYPIAAFVLINKTPGVADAHDYVSHAYHFSGDTSVRLINPNYSATDDLAGATLTPIDQILSKFERPMASSKRIALGFGPTVPHGYWLTKGNTDIHFADVFRQEAYPLYKGSKWLSAELYRDGTLTTPSVSLDSKDLLFKSPGGRADYRLVVSSEHTRGTLAGSIKEAYTFKHGDAVIDTRPPTLRQMLIVNNGREVSSLKAGRNDIYVHVVPNAPTDDLGLLTGSDTIRELTVSWRTSPSSNWVRHTTYNQLSSTVPLQISKYNTHQKYFMKVSAVDEAGNTMEIDLEIPAAVLYKVSPSSQSEPKAAGS